MDKDTVEFATYCIGNLSRRLGLNARDVYERLKTSGTEWVYCTEL